VTRPLSLTWQTLLQILLLLAAGLLFLPITPSDGWNKPVASGDPTWRSVDAPYALLATTSPMLQGWLAQLPGHIEISRLFAVSNFASCLGLLSYPFI